MINEVMRRFFCLLSIVCFVGVEGSLIVLERYAIERWRRRQVVYILEPVSPTQPVCSECLVCVWLHSLAQVFLCGNLMRPE
jgi:hypothetical protein